MLIDGKYYIFVPVGEGMDNKLEVSKEEHDRIEKIQGTAKPTLHQLLQKRSLIKEAFKRFKVPQSAVQDQIDDGSIGDRAGGDVECPKCGLFYRDHPTVEGIEGCIVTCAWKVYHI